MRNFRYLLNDLPTNIKTIYEMSNFKKTLQNYKF